MAVPHDTIAAVVFQEDIANVQFRLEIVLKDYADVLAHDDELSSSGESTPSPPSETHTITVSWNVFLGLLLEIRLLFLGNSPKVCEAELVTSTASVTFCHSTCFMLLLKLERNSAILLFIWQFDQSLCKF